MKKSVKTSKDARGPGDLPNCGSVGARKKNLSRFGRRNPEKFNFENLWKFVEILDSVSQSGTQWLSDTPPIEATAEGVA